MQVRRSGRLAARRRGPGVQLPVGARPPAGGAQAGRGEEDRGHDRSPHTEGRPEGGKVVILILPHTLRFDMQPSPKMILYVIPPNHTFFVKYKKCVMFLTNCARKKKKTP